MSTVAVELPIVLTSIIADVCDTVEILRDIELMEEEHKLRSSSILAPSLAKEWTDSFKLSEGEDNEFVFIDSEEMEKFFKQFSGSPWRIVFDFLASNCGCTALSGGKVYDFGRGVSKTSSSASSPVDHCLRNRNESCLAMTFLGRGRSRYRSKVPVEV
jgi:hypothetical protein